MLRRIAVGCREPSFRYTPGVPVVYLAGTDVIESGVMDVSQGSLLERLLLEIISKQKSPRFGLIKMTTKSGKAQ